MSALRRAPLIGRRALLATAAIVVIIGITIVLSGSLTRSTDVEAQAERARAEIARIEGRLAAAEKELRFVQTEDFIRQQARVFGFGEAGERPFELEAGAPSPAPIVPIGPQEAGVPPPPPFEAWMELLFGA